MKNHLLLFPGTIEQYVWLLNSTSFNDTGKEKKSIHRQGIWDFPPHVNFFSYMYCIVRAQGKGEFTMEYKEHSPVSQDVQMQLVNTHKANKAAE